MKEIHRNSGVNNKDYAIDETNIFKKLKARLNTMREQKENPSRKMRTIERIKRKFLD